MNTTLERSTPSTRTLILPSGSLRLCTMLTMVPTLKISLGLGSSIEASCWVARKIFLSLAMASSNARTLDSRPPTNGVIMYGKMTTSRIGIIGRRFVSDFSFEVSIDLPWRDWHNPSPQVRGVFRNLRLTGFFQYCKTDFLREHHLFGDLELAYFLVGWQVVHQIQHQVFENHPQATRAHLALHGQFGDGFNGVVAEPEAHVLEFEQLLILLDDGVLGPGQDLDQG